VEGLGGMVLEDRLPDLDLVIGAVSLQYFFLVALGIAFVGLFVSGDADVKVGGWHGWRIEHLSAIKIWPTQDCN